MKRDINLETRKRNTFISYKLDSFCVFAKENDFVEITEWINGDGFDFHVSASYKTEDFSLSYGAWELIRKMMKQILNSDISRTETKSE